MAFRQKLSLSHTKQLLMVVVWDTCFSVKLMQTLYSLNMLKGSGSRAERGLRIRNHFTKLYFAANLFIENFGFSQTSPRVCISYCHQCTQNAHFLVIIITEKVLDIVIYLDN